MALSCKLVYDSPNLWAYIGENLASRLQFSLFTARIYNTIPDIGRRRTGNLSSKIAWFMIPYDLDDAVVIEFG